MMIRVNLNEAQHRGMVEAKAVPLCRPKARGWGAKRTPGQMNGLERRYSVVLDARLAAGEIAGHWYEKVTLRLAKKTSLTPDFLVMLPDGLLEFHDTKGFFAEHNRVKWKVACEMFPQFRFVLVTSKKGQWTLERSE